jgi:enamine deaminase RidA (YjgF/YER057c/UK114 family)
MSDDIRIEVTTDAAGRRRASTGSTWEPVMGYSRAVRAGNLVFVTGTVGIRADGTYPSTIAEQTRRSLDIITAALASLGARPEHVVRTRIYCTDVRLWREIASVHGQVFADIRPATTLVGVKELIDPEALIEIEADAVVG